MKNIIDYINEGILDDIETTLSISDDDMKNKLNGKIPTVKDFKKSPINRDRHNVYWECPMLISQYVKNINLNLRPGVHFNINNIMGIRISIVKALMAGEYYFQVGLYDTKLGFVNQLNGIAGAGELIKLPEAKKIAIKFINNIAKDHNKLNDLIQIHNSSKYSNPKSFVSYVNNM